MKIVCDIDVLASGVLFGGHAREILHRAAQGSLTNFVTQAILQEVEEVLLRPKFGLKPEHVLQTLALFADTFEMVCPTCRIETVKADPDDNMILEAAVAASVDYIISGDKHLLNLGKYREIHMVSPAEFMNKNGNP
ncbi:MAG TPA: putative toxin-antitoxin system toxin component, PIN family [Verrucomicrobia bacterium]|nr:putative toxin-antitoxin system toxin component, PIN family [Verrucomicrobiota bacterium]